MRLGPTVLWTCLGIAVASLCVPAGALNAQAQDPKGSARIIAIPVTPDDVARRLREKEEAIAAEPQIDGLSRRLSYYLRTRQPHLAPLTRSAASADNLRFAVSELGQHSPFACVGDFDGNGLEDTVLVVWDQTEDRFEVVAFHQVHVTTSPGNHRSQDYQPYPVSATGHAGPDAKPDSLLIICHEPGRFESVEGQVTLILKNHSVYFGFSLLYFLDGRYQSLLIAD